MNPKQEAHELIKQFSSAFQEDRVDEIIYQLTRSSDEVKGEVLSMATWGLAYHHQQAALKQAAEQAKLLAKVNEVSNQEQDKE